MAVAIDGDVRDKLRLSGYTLTSQRRAVLDALEESEGHPSAEDVYLLVKKRNPRVALGTVYQALSVLEEVGVIESKHWSESPTRYDVNTVPHTDIRCTRCGAVDEVPNVECAELEGTVRANTAYRVNNVSLVIEGICPVCQGPDRAS